MAGISAVVALCADLDYSCENHKMNAGIYSKLNV